MQSEKIKLFNRELYLTERKAFDVYEIEEYYKKNNSQLGLVFGDALFIQAGLKFNLEKICVKIMIFGNELSIPFRPFLYLRYKKILSAKYLLKKLTRNEMNDLIGKIWFLETDEYLKKKVTMKQKTVEKESAENIPQH